MNDVLKQFIDSKASSGMYLKLPNNGDSAVIARLDKIERVKKLAFDKKTEKDFIQLTMQVQTPDGLKTQIFENASPRFAQAMINAGINVGDGFKIIRDGMAMETRYVFTDVKKGAESPNIDTTEEINTDDIPF